jgi:hypothetical protein
VRLPKEPVVELLCPISFVIGLFMTSSALHQSYQHISSPLDMSINALPHLSLGEGVLQVFHSLIFVASFARSKC